MNILFALHLLVIYDESAELCALSKTPGFSAGFLIADD